MSMSTPGLAGFCAAAAEDTPIRNLVHLDAFIYMNDTRKIISEDGNS